LPCGWIVEIFLLAAIECILILFITYVIFAQYDIASYSTSLVIVWASTGYLHGSDVIAVFIAFFLHFFLSEIKW